MSDVKQGVTLTEPDIQDNNSRVQERERLQGRSHLGAHKGISALSIHNN